MKTLVHDKPKKNDTLSPKILAKVFPLALGFNNIVSGQCG